VDILRREQSASGVLTLTLHRPERKNAPAEWAGLLAAGPPVALAQTKRLLAESSGRSFEAALEAECSAQSVNLATEDTREAFRAFFAKREPRFEGK